MRLTFHAQTVLFQTVPNATLKAVRSVRINFSDIKGNADQAVQAKVSQLVLGERNVSIVPFTVISVHRD